MSAIFFIAEDLIIFPFCYISIIKCLNCSIDAFSLCHTKIVNIKLMQFLCERAFNVNMKSMIAVDYSIRKFIQHNNYVCWYNAFNMQFNMHLITNYSYKIKPQT